MLDLSAPAPADNHSRPQWLVLLDGRRKPLGDPERPAALSVVGCYSDQYVAAQRDLALRAFSRASASKDASAAELAIRRDDLGLDVLLAAVVDWRNIDDGGKPAPFSRDLLRKLLKGYPFVREQLELFIHTDRNFPSAELPPSSSGPESNSASTTPTP
jgi:hypothetical protein